MNLHTNTPSLLSDEERWETLLAIVQAFHDGVASLPSYAESAHGQVASTLLKQLEMDRMLRTRSSRRRSPITDMAREAELMAYEDEQLR